MKSLIQAVDSLVNGAIKDHYDAMERMNNEHIKVVVTFGSAANVLRLLEIKTYFQGLQKALSNNEGEEKETARRWYFARVQEIIALSMGNLERADGQSKIAALGKVLDTLRVPLYAKGVLTAEEVEMH